MNANLSSTKAGWRPKMWAQDVNISRAKTYQLINDGSIETVKIGAARIIVTSPADYLRSLAKQSPKAA
jgi:hypothetical protein